MGKASSSKKVQRAARAAASSRGASERRELGFPLVIGLVVLLGIALIVVANREQNNQVKAAPLLSDHWHAAYSIYDCDQYLTPFQGSDAPLGIHSHMDGLIHIHPSSSNATGEDAQIGVFLEAMGATLDEDTFESSEHGVLEAGSDCDGESTVWRVGRFRVDPDVSLVEVFDTELSSVQFDRDREAFTIARVPADAEMPPPDQSALDQLDQTSPSDPLEAPGQVDIPLDGTDTGGADTGGADTGGADTGGADTGGADPGAGADGATG